MQISHQAVKKFVISALEDTPSGYKGVSKSFRTEVITK